MDINTVETIKHYNETHTFNVTHTAEGTDYFTMYAATEFCVYVEVHSNIGHGRVEVRELTISVEAFEQALARNNGSRCDITEV